MFKGANLGVCFGGRCGIIDDAMTDVAIGGDDFAVVADVFAIVTAETPREI